MRSTPYLACAFWALAACSGESSSGDFNKDTDPSAEVDDGQGDSRKPSQPGEGSPRRSTQLAVAGGAARSNNYRARLVVTVPSKSAGASSEAGRVQLIVPAAEAK